MVGELSIRVQVRVTYDGSYSRIRVRLGSDKDQGFEYKTSLNSDTSIAWACDCSHIRSSIFCAI